MNNIACHLEQSVEAEASPLFAWGWRTDIENWDDPPAQFQLEDRRRDGQARSGVDERSPLPIGCYDACFSAGTRSSAAGSAGKSVNGSD